MHNVLVRPSTYRRWAHLIMGGALLVPFVLLTILVIPSALPLSPGTMVSFVLFTLMLGLMVLVSFIPVVRAIEGSAARELLGDPVPPPRGAAPMSWPARWRSAGWFLTHLLIGGVVSVLTVFLPPIAALCAAAPFTGQLTLLTAKFAFRSGWSSAWLLAVAVALLAVLLGAVLAGSRVLIKLAPTLLGPTAAERMAELREQAAQLAQRNRLARELHDSVGHALSIVTVQAGAARRVLEHDPEFARTALDAISTAARNALEELDHVLGVLRADERRGTERVRTLADLPELIVHAGLPVELEADELDEVPAWVSREAYRIIQECLTNALRHGTGEQVRLTLRCTADTLTIEVLNPVGGAPRDTGGRGLAGIRERVTVLDGTMENGVSEGEWRVSVRLPLRSGS